MSKPICFSKWTTLKIKEVLVDPFTRDSKGRDYEEDRQELENILYEREDREAEKELLEWSREWT